MRTLCKMVLAVAAVALVVNLASAQQRQRPGGGGGGRGGLGQLLQTKEVQKELDLSDEQIEKAKKVTDAIQEKHKDDFAKLQDVPQDERFTKMRELGVQVREETMKDLGDVLKPEQTKRLKQLVLQQTVQFSGPGIFLTPDVEKGLSLTDKQKDDLKTMADDYRKEMREAFQPGGDRAEAAKKMAEMRKEGMDKALKVLDDKQKTTWEEMNGKEFKFPAPGGRGRGGNPPPR
jgi:Spy/CpxP family protein refolding chaperone